MRPTIHLVYPHGRAASAPDVIGRRLGEYLSHRYHVILYNWDELSRIRPDRGDILIGHPHPLPGTIFRRSFSQRGWARRIVMSPFNGSSQQVAFLDRYVRCSDAYVAITGPWWFDRVPFTDLSHWAPHMVQLDLAVDRDVFPRVKHSFAPGGRRRLLYIGHAGWQKNVSYLSDIALARPQWDFAWLGPGREGDIKGVEHLGFRDTALEDTRKLIASFDFFVTLGRSDANPMTVLEAMAWGLLPFCTHQSGYVGVPGIVNLPLDDLEGALGILDHWQDVPETVLMEMQRANLDLLDTHYTWERFGRTVEQAIWRELPPTLALPIRRRIELKVVTALSPYSIIHGEGRRMGSAAIRGAVRKQLRGALGSVGGR